MRLDMASMATLLSSTSAAPCRRLRKSPRFLHHPLSPSASSLLSELSASTITSASAALCPLSSSSSSSSSLFPARVDAQAPLAVVATSIARWLDLYSAALTLRVLLSWLPNLPWHRQPLSALRDLCDPYLALFRSIIPPLFGTLDLTPLLAFAALAALSSLLKAALP